MRERKEFKHKDHVGISIYIGRVALTILNLNLPSLGEEIKRHKKRFDNLIQINNKKKI